MKTIVPAKTWTQLTGTCYQVFHKENSNQEIEYNYLPDGTLEIRPPKNMALYIDFIPGLEPKSYTDVHYYDK